MLRLCVICPDRARIESLSLPRGRRLESGPIFSFFRMLAFLEVCQVSKFLSFPDSEKKRTVSDAEQGCPATEERILGCHGDGSDI